MREANETFVSIENSHSLFRFLLDTAAIEQATGALPLPSHVHRLPREEQPQTAGRDPDDAAQVPRVRVARARQTAA